MENVPIDPLLFLLGAVLNETSNMDQRHILRVLLLIAKKMMTVNQEDVKPQIITKCYAFIKALWAVEIELCCNRLL